MLSMLVGMKDSNVKFLINDLAACQDKKTDFLLELVEDADVNLLRSHRQGDTSGIGLKKEDVREPVFSNE